ncbi:MAG: GrpB family protein [Rhodoferax sp.]
MDEQQSWLAALHERVRLHSYDPSWAEVFLLERDRLLSLFPHRFLGIEHIGSTAVPGLSAKPVVDMLAGVESMAVAQALAEPLCRSGYTTSAELNATLSGP